MKTVLEIETVLRNSLPILAELINKELGFAPKLHIKVSNNRIDLSSDDLMNELGNTLVKTIFKSIKLNFGGGEIAEDRNSIWFNPRISYEHPLGGKNGTDFLWSGLWFDLKEKTWITGRSIIQQTMNY